MSRTFIILFLALLLTTARADHTLYVLGWSSPQPVQIERVTVTGGALVQVLSASDGISGTIAATAPRACLVIVAEGRTVAGAGVRLSRAWADACDRLYLPVLR